MQQELLEIICSKQGFKRNVDHVLSCNSISCTGQGYIWMIHKSPASDTWELTMRSHELWKMLAESIRDQGLNPLEVLGWKKTGIFVLSKSSLSLVWKILNFLKI